MDSQKDKLEQIINDTPRNSVEKQYDNKEWWPLYGIFKILKNGPRKEVEISAQDVVIAAYHALTSTAIGIGAYYGIHALISQLKQ